MPESIFRYFPSLTETQKSKFSELKEIYIRWNNMINVISRKDMDDFYIHHVLHSLAIAKVIEFMPGMRIMDVGTGGGFPGIPLAILYPENEFTLLDSIEKKIKVVRAVSDELGLTNVIPVRKRIEEENNKFQFVISRAVTQFPAFVKMTSRNILKQVNKPGNGIICLKGGNLDEEIGSYKEKVRIWQIKDFFNEPYFDTKVIVYLPV